MPIVCGVEGGGVTDYRGIGLRQRMWAKRSNERAAAAVELALVAPLLVLLLFGTIDIGLVLSDVVSVRQATREGARNLAVGAYYETGGRCNPATDLVGFGVTARDTEMRNLLCSVKNRIGMSKKSRVYLQFADPLDPSIPLSDASELSLSTDPVSPALEKVADEMGEEFFVFRTGEHRSVWVCVQVESKSRTGILAPVFNDKVLKPRVVMRMADFVKSDLEPASRWTAGRLFNGGETSFPGQTWDDCRGTGSPRRIGYAR
jgi:TadE-like protein